MPEAGVSRDDLRAAVASGVLDEAQATRLIALADQRQGYRANMIGDDEVAYVYWIERPKE